MQANKNWKLKKLYDCYQLKGQNFVLNRRPGSRWTVATTRATTLPSSSPNGRREMQLQWQVQLQRRNRFATTVTFRTRSTSTATRASITSEPWTRPGQTAQPSGRSSLSLKRTFRHRDSWDCWKLVTFKQDWLSNTNLNFVSCSKNIFFISLPSHFRDWFTLEVY